MKIYLCLCLFLFSCVHLLAIPPQKALTNLVEGNKRFQSNKAINPHQDLARREATSSGQMPFAIIVACADSRVAPEILFDQGIGDLFVVRVAGAVIGPLEMESIEFAAKVLGCSCIIVMGHEACGAVNAVLQEKSADIRFIAQLIHPAILQAKRSGKPDLLRAAIEFNAQNVRDFCLESSIISTLLKQKKVIVKAAYYDFDTGFVNML
jgi:carbonic anhydrase